MYSINDFYLKIQQIKQFYQEKYDGVTLLYVLEGEVDVMSESICITLHSDDLLLLNRGSTYQITAKQKNIVLKLEITSHCFIHYFNPYPQTLFHLVPGQNLEFKQRYRDTIVRQLVKMALTKLKNHDESVLEQQHILSKIMLLLVYYFQDHCGQSALPNKPRYSRRIQDMIDYIHRHYQQKITLKQLAEREFISFAYLSRLFKQEVGMTFTQYLMQVKFNRAVTELLSTSKPIYQIVEEQGFVSAKQFTSMFKQVYQQTPKQYRQSPQLPQPRQPVSPNLQPLPTDVAPVDLEQLLPKLNAVLSQVQADDSSDSTLLRTDELAIDLPVQYKALPLRRLNYILSVGEIKQLLNQNMQQQIQDLLVDSHIDYVDVEHLISGNALQAEMLSNTLMPTYSFFSQIDMAVDFLYQRNIALLVRIYHHSVEQQQDYLNKLAILLTHCLNRYGLDYLQRWRFIYYPPGEFTADDTALLGCYQSVRAQIKQLLPNSLCGFFHPYLGDKAQREPFWNSKLISQIDFLGYSADPNHPVEPLPDSSEPNSEVFYIEQVSRLIQQQLKARHIDIPLVLLKWNTFTGQTWQTNGSYFRGALILQTLLALSKQIESVAFVLNTDLLQQASQPMLFDISGIALYYQFNTRRPIYYVLKLLNRLRGAVIAHTNDYLLTQTADGYQLLLLNIALFNPSLSTEQHLLGSYRRRRIVTIRGISAGEYQIRQYIFDQQHGAVYASYNQFPTRYGRDQEAIDYINRTTVPYLSVYDETIEFAKWELLVELEVNAVQLYELRRVCVMDPAP